MTHVDHDPVLDLETLTTPNRIILDVPQMTFRPQSIIVPSWALFQFMAWGIVQTPNASLETLTRRICYGGRKGRSARRRMQRFNRLATGNVSLRRLLTPYRRGQPNRDFIDENGLFEPLP